MTDPKHQPLAEQKLVDYKSKHPNPETMTTSWGAPVPTLTASLTVGPHGNQLMEDAIYFDEISRFDRERIPERVVHAKGGGAHGYFEVTHDITKYTKAALFSEVGKKTPMFIRFSIVGGERGAADTSRDARGFAMKFYTEEGNWDLVGNNTPIFFIRDPMLFTSFIHTQKRNPATNLKDPNMVWDFFSLRPETVHQFMILFSDRGTPDGYRHMNGYGSHAFKLVNKDNDFVYCKFHIKTDQGIKNLSAEEAGDISGKDADYANRDLMNAIENGDFPKWTMHIQVMTQEEADKSKFNPFDLTKTWPHKEFPLQQVGKIVLNKNPTNYHAEVEQVAYSPAHIISGIEFSPDKMLQGRIFSYTDTQNYRLGVNHKDLAINCPYRTRVSNIQRDGLMAVKNPEDAPNHYPNSFNGPKPDPAARGSTFQLSGVVDRHESGDEDNFSQPRIFWEKVFKPDERQRLVDNICDGLSLATHEIQERSTKVFMQVHEDFGKAVAEGLKKRDKDSGILSRTANAISSVLPSSS